MNTETSTFISASRVQICELIDVILNDVQTVIGRYDEVYNSLVVNRDPKAFCEFLLAAPPLFMDLGEMIGAVEHVVSYWKFRFPDEAPLVADAEEVEAIFQDFVMSFPRKTFKADVAA